MKVIILILKENPSTGEIEAIWEGRQTTSATPKETAMYEKIGDEVHKLMMAQAPTMVFDQTKRDV